MIIMYFGKNLFASKTGTCDNFEIYCKMQYFTRHWKIVMSVIASEMFAHSDMQVIKRLMVKVFI